MGSFVNALITSSLMTASTTTLQGTETKLAWTPEVMIQTKSLADVQIAPNHSSILFVVTQARMEKEKGTLFSKICKTTLGSKQEPISLSPEDISSTQPRWSPDGKWIAFLANQTAVKQLALLPAEGGEIIFLTSGTRDVQTFSWSPDGSKIAFVMADETETAKNAKKTSLAFVYGETTAVNRLWIACPFAPETPAYPLTPDNYSVRGCGDFGTANTEFDWSPDSKQITFAYSLNNNFDSFHLDSSLATLDLETSCITPLEKKVRFEAMPRYSPDGSSIAYLSSNSDEKYSIDRQLAIRSLTTDLVTILASTFNEGPFLAGPHFLGWSADGLSLLFFEPKGTKFHLVLVPIDGSAPKDVETGHLFFKEPTLSPNKTMLGFVAQTPDTPPEAFVAILDDFIPTQISSVNQPLLSYPKPRTESISWRAPDETQIEGLLTYPIDYQEGKQYPLLLVVHGGPMGFFDETFLGTPNPYPLACFAEAGFMLLRPNPRGSTGYGKAFRCGNYGDFGGRDFLDNLSGVDALIAGGLVDPEKLGIMGWSYGGYITAWAITQTSRFKAASTGAGLSNLVSMNGITDLHHFLTDYLGEFPAHRKLYEERSPINYVQNVETPCLIQHGVDDPRVPVSQAYEWYHALNRLEKEVSLVLYPGMHHRLFDPNMQLDAMQRNLSWFEKYLKINR